MGHYNLFKMRLKFSFVIVFMYCIYCTNAKDEFIASNTQSPSTLSPFIDILFVCPMQSEPWQCSRLQFGRMLDDFETVISNKNEQLKAEADAYYENSVEVRGFSEIEVAKKQKPSSIMNTIENYFNNGINNIMGRNGENEKSKNKKKKPLDIGDAIHIDLTGHGGHNDHGHDHDHHGGHNHIGLHGIKKKKHGRSLIDEGRGKKKKKKKAMLKLLLVGAIIKAKIELLLKLLATHLQIKFFVVALLGLLINLARFWFDLKKGNQPQKVIYYEHAQHQHHYDEHDDGWGGGGSGGYWKRSLNTNPLSKSIDADNNYDESGEKHPVDAFYDEIQRTKELNLEGASPSDPFDYAQTPKTGLLVGVDSHVRAYNKQIPNINVNN